MCNTFSICPYHIQIQFIITYFPDSIEQVRSGLGPWRTGILLILRKWRIEPLREINCKSWKSWLIGLDMASNSGTLLLTDFTHALTYFHLNKLTNNFPKQYAMLHHIFQTRFWNRCFLILTHVFIFSWCSSKCTNKQIPPSDKFKKHK